MTLGKCGQDSKLWPDDVERKKRCSGNYYTEDKWSRCTLQRPRVLGTAARNFSRAARYFRLLCEPVVKEADDICRCAFVKSRLARTRLAQGDFFFIQWTARRLLNYWSRGICGAWNPKCMRAAKLRSVEWTQLIKRWHLSIVNIERLIFLISLCSNLINICRRFVCTELVQSSCQSTRLENKFLQCEHEHLFGSGTLRIALPCLSIQISH